MEPLKALEVRRVESSADLAQPGDYVFIGKREPVRRFTPMWQEPPHGFFRRVWHIMFGKPYELQEHIEIIWPDYDAVIINCPHCNAPVGTTKDHRIVTIEPLTIEKPVACAYSRGAEKGSLPTVAFHVKEGKIMLV